MSKELTMKKTELPDGWEMKELGEIADVEYGFTDKSTTEGDYRYVRITDIDSNGKLLESGKKYIKYSTEAEVFLIKDNALLMARTGATFGKVLLYKNFEPSVFASYLIKIEFKEEFENTLYWYFTKTKSYWEQANNLSSGAAQPHFNGKAVKKVLFPYPKSLPQQKQIVAILDKAFAAIDTAKANAKQNLQNAKELFESYLQNVFDNKGDDWEEKTLGDIGKVSMCKRILKKQTNPETGIPFYKIGTLGKQANAFISKEIYQEFKEKYSLPKKGDILIAASGATVGKNFIYDGEPAYFQDSNIVWIDNNGEDVLNEYLYKFYGYCDWNPSKGATIPRLYNDDLRRIQVPYPTSIEEQKQIVQKLDALSAETKKLESIYTQKIADLEEMKKSVLQKAFSGELTIKN